MLDDETLKLHGDLVDELFAEHQRIRMPVRINKTIDEILAGLYADEDSEDGLDTVTHTKSKKKR